MPLDINDVIEEVMLIYSDSPYAVALLRTCRKRPCDLGHNAAHQRRNMTGRGRMS